METRSISVWFFIGFILSIYGLLVLATGIYELFVPLKNQIAMAHLHIGIWWGAGMLLFGLVYLIRFRPKVQHNRFTAVGGIHGKA
jgi:hypothetical protein